MQMLQFIKTLRRGTEIEVAELSAAATIIYQKFFSQLLTESKVEHCKLQQEVSQSLFVGFDANKTNQEHEIAVTPDDVWIFGYGSLVWKADFPYIDRRRGYVCGYKRRFYQHSIDHRGVPEKPGRVVTLLPGDAAVDRVYGVAYRIAASQKSEVLDHLDIREKNGYERCILEFHEYSIQKEPNALPIEVIMYVATQANESYAGNVWQVPRIAEQIFTSAGPSGPNREYLFNLAIAMRELFPGAKDEHLCELVDCVQRYIENDEPVLLESALSKEITNILKECLLKQSMDDAAVAQRLNELREQYHRPGWREAMLTKELQLNNANNSH